ncbi:TetR/AcrR family transcriptional regulator [Amycolatopsis echigonensis]|uniref:TetR family transcriptional regulator n=1 Tax=Amycolatopsis echigonensis TaxID=2576905 RepID=A0A2N3WN78_9PSEU|nr:MULTISPECIES: TetR/AcrR family transcriptional regulator [Amycolatopsis]MBB2503873.1 TetR/AcrR family transcriptional regulator [Amycolatopsis echigonensis]PKV95324.1 TetR family transcriptional regulator [Amycolatopsis niigatensis]
MARKPANTTSSAGGKSARTRQRILDAAAHVLSRKGFAGTRLTDVAEVAELQAPAIYYHFPSREELIEEVMWSGIANMTDHVQQQLDALPPETGPLDRIEVAVESHLRYQLETSDYTTAAIRNAGQLPDNMRARYEAEANRYGDVWRRLFDAAKREGALRPDLDARAARMLVLGALNWAAEWWNPRRGTLDQVIRTAKSLVRAGLAVPEAVEAEPMRKPQRSRARKPAKTASNR